MVGRGEVQECLPGPDKVQSTLENVLILNRLDFFGAPFEDQLPPAIDATPHHHALAYGR